MPSSDGIAFHPRRASGSLTGCWSPSLPHVHQATNRRPSRQTLGRFFLFCIWKCGRGDRRHPATNLKSCIRTLHQHPRPGVVDKLPLSTLIFPRNGQAVDGAGAVKAGDTRGVGRAKKAHNVRANDWALMPQLIATSTASPCFGCRSTLLQLPNN